MKSIEQIEELLKGLDNEIKTAFTKEMRSSIMKRKAIYSHARFILQLEPTEASLRRELERAKEYGSTKHDYHRKHDLLAIELILSE